LSRPGSSRTGVRFLVILALASFVTSGGGPSPVADETARSKVGHFDCLRVANGE
jgi:hypothetical protein